MTALNQFLKKSLKQPEILPLIAIVGTALGGAVFISTRLVKAPDVVWDHKHNPYPWQDIKESEQVKLMTVNQKYENGRWERTRW